MCIRICGRYADLYVVGFVFFFKQKTAYEMRISDWSSDVCSSDLHANMSRGTATEIHGTDRKGCAVEAGREIDRVFDRLHSILHGARVNRTIAEEINGRTFGIANGEAEKDGAGVPESHQIGRAHV